MPLPAQREYGPTLGQYQVVGYADINPEKLEAGQTIEVEYTADCASTVKFQGEVKGTLPKLSQNLGTWENSNEGANVTAIGHAAVWNIPADKYTTQVTEADINKIKEVKENGFTNVRVSFSTNTNNNKIKSFEIKSVKVLNGETEVTDAVTNISSKYTFAGVTNGSLAKVSLKGYYDPSKYDKVSVKCSVAGSDEDLSIQVKVEGSVDCKKPISSNDWDKQVAAIEYSGAKETSVTKELSFAGLADGDVEPSINIAIYRETGKAGFTGTVTIEEIKLIAKK